MDDSLSTDQKIALFLGDKLSTDESPDYLADPATADRVLARIKALVWQASIAERADGTWEAEITNKEGQEFGYIASEDCWKK